MNITEAVKHHMQNKKIIPYACQKKHF
jgi:hypothetical protein